MGHGYWILLWDGFREGLNLINPRLHVDSEGNNWWSTDGLRQVATDQRRGIHDTIDDTSFGTLYLDDVLADLCRDDLGRDAEALNPFVVRRHKLPWLDEGTLPESWLGSSRDSEGFEGVRGWKVILS